MTAPSDTDVTAKVTVVPEVFSLIDYDPAEISEVVMELTERLGIGNRVRVEVDESTPLAKLSAELVDADGNTVEGAGSSDDLIVIHAESGALEQTKRLTTFSREHALESLGRMLLRACDRMRADFADAPPDVDLSRAENAAWDAYCAGRLARAGYTINEQRFRYNLRNRLGFDDGTDTEFDRVWSADDLAWSDLPTAD